MQVRLPSEPHPGLVTARAARAVRPRPGADSLRGAYLELLKLCLCDLEGTSTTSVGRGEGGVVWSRELRGEQLRLRAAGMDWPLQGLTMAGLRRLDDLQSCVESVVRDHVEGDLIEAGAWRGGASILMRATLDSLGVDERTVFVADSFEGFPMGQDGDFPDDRELDDLGVFNFLAVSLEEVKGNFARLGCDRGVTFVPGFFEETMPGLRDGRWSLVRLDGDTYEATRLTLESLYPRLSAGGYLIVDDYGALEECRHGVDEFRREHGIEEPLEEIDWTCVRWRREDDAPIAAEPPAARRNEPRPRAPRAVERRTAATVPTIAELDLQREVEELRRGLAEAEARIRRLQSGPLRAPRAWLRRRLKRSSVRVSR